MDLNILIATVVTATAALIAIIGGFLVSRVITLSSEQSSIRRRLREIRLNIQTKERLLAEVEENLLAEDQEDFITDYYCELIFDHFPLEELLEHDGEPYRGRTIKDLQPVVEELNQINSELQEMFRQQGISYSTDLPTEFSDFVSKESLTMSHRQYWYELLYDEYQSRMEKRPKPAQGAFGSLDMSGIRFSHPHDQLSATMRTQETERAYQQKLRDRNTYKNDVDYLKKQEEEHEEVLGD